MTRGMSTTAIILLVGFITLALGVGIAIYIIGWAVVIWTFQVNALWGVIVGFLWLFITYMGQIANKSRKSS